MTDELLTMLEEQYECEIKAVANSKPTNVHIGTDLEMAEDEEEEDDDATEDEVSWARVYTCWQRRFRFHAAS